MHAAIHAGRGRLARLRRLLGIAPRSMMGIKFYSMLPSHLSPKELVATILMTAGQDTRRAGP